MHWDSNQSDFAEGYHEDEQNLQFVARDNPQYDFEKGQKVPFADMLKRGGRENSVLPFATQTRFLEIRLKAATFDPLKDGPIIPPGLTYQHENSYYLVQCMGPIQPDWLGTLQNAGAVILGYIPEYTYLVHMEGRAKAEVSSLQFVRWVGPYHPAYKIQEGLLELDGDVELNVVVFKDKNENLQKVRRELAVMGGIITSNGDEDHTIRVTIDVLKIRNVAFVSEV